MPLKGRSPWAVKKRSQVSKAVSAHGLRNQCGTRLHAFLTFSLASYKAVAGATAALSVVCGHTKVFVNDLSLARELLASLPSQTTATLSSAALSETASQFHNLVATKLDKHCAHRT